MRQEHNGEAIDHIAGDGDLELLLRPTLNIGDELELSGKTVTIAEIRGDEVRVDLSAAVRREALPRGGHVAFGPGSAVVKIGELVSENARDLLNSQGGA